MQADLPLQQAADVPCGLDPLCLLTEGHEADCLHRPGDGCEKPLPVPIAGVPASLPVPNVDPERLLAQAVASNVPIETLERLLALREKLKAEQARTLFFAALAAFQGECPIIGKNKTAKIEGSRGSYSYSYAPLDEIVRQVGPILQRHGLSYTFDTRDEERAKVVLCHIHHVAGHSESTTFRVPVDQGARMNDAQKDASAVTYGRRYAFCGSLGILTGDADDDGHLGGTKDGDKPTGGSTSFDPPKRASETKPPLGTGKQHTGPGQRCWLCHPDGGGTCAKDKADNDKGPKPQDAITDGKVKRVYALISAALDRHGLRHTANVELIEAELDRTILEQRKLKSWKFCSWKGADYASMCDAIDPLVDGLVAEGVLKPQPVKTHARFVGRRP